MKNRFLIALSFLAIVSLSAVVIGLGSMIFLNGLEWAAEFRGRHFASYFLSPFVGLLSGCLFVKFFASSNHGNILMVTLLRKKPQPVLSHVPKALAPIIVVMTWLSHLSGMSVGREGTAVQMGGGVAAAFGRRFSRFLPPEVEIYLLRIGVAAGFASVFGVPIAGSVFSLEVARDLKPLVGESWPRQSIKFLKMILPCLVASYIADTVTRKSGGHHAYYLPLDFAEFFTLKTVFAQLLAAVFYGVSAWLFLFCLHRFRIAWAALIKQEILRPMIGGGLFLVLIWLFQPWMFRYAGLGTDVIQESMVRTVGFQDTLMKLLCTVFSIGVGFKGGEVTPLFYMGATAGSAISGLFGLAPGWLASMGLVACFGAAADVPIASAFMAGELFGWSAFPVALVVCYLAHWFCRHARLYDAKPEI